MNIHSRWMLRNRGVNKSVGRVSSWNHLRPNRTSVQQTRSVQILLCPPDLAVHHHGEDQSQELKSNTHHLYPYGDEDIKVSQRYNIGRESEYPRGQLQDTTFMYTLKLCFEKVISS